MLQLSGVGSLFTTRKDTLCVFSFVFPFFLRGRGNSRVKVREIFESFKFEKFYKIQKSKKKKKNNKKKK